MTDRELPPKRGARAVRISLLLFGALLIAYALSDNSFYGGEPGFGGTQALIAVIGAAVALCALLPVDIGGRILLLTVTGLVALGVTEIAGEVFLGPRYRPVYQYDARLIFKLIPNRRSVMTRLQVNGGQTVVQHINSEGYRGGELLPPGTASRVVVYGDSFIHAYYSPAKETFVNQLGAMLGKRLGRRFEVVNAGVSSYGPDQELVKMEEELPGLRPALVIVAVYAGNDYGDLMRNKMFRLDASGGLVRNHWRLDPKVRMLLQLGQRESILKRAARSIYERFKGQEGGHAIDMDFLLHESEREYRDYIVDHDNVVTNIYVDYYSANISLEPNSPSSRYEIALMRQVMRRMRDVAARDHVPLIFLFIPHASDVTSRYDNWRVDRNRYPEYDGRNQIAPLENAARDLGVPFVSLYDVFRARDANLLYFHGGNDHWNAAGQKLAARAMAGYLLDRGFPRWSGDGQARTGAH